MLSTIEKIKNGYLVHVEQPSWSETKKTKIMGTELDPQDTWYAATEADVYKLLGEHFFIE